MVNYACAFSQSELGKYFEWIIFSHFCGGSHVKREWGASFSLGVTAANVLNAWLIVFYYIVFMVTLLAMAVLVQLLANCQVSDGHVACQNLDIRNSQ